MNVPLYGLVLVGGKSRRMGRDKALIAYDQRTTQLEHTAILLQEVCDSVFISKREDQRFDLPKATKRDSRPST